MRSSEIHELANPKEKSDPHVAVYKCTFIVKYRSEKNKEEHKARFRQPIKCKGFLNKLLTMLNLLLRKMFLYWFGFGLRSSRIVNYNEVLYISSERGSLKTEKME